MRLKLSITKSVDGDVFELILKKARYRIGRRFDNDLRIKETYISAYHSEINLDDDGGYWLSDCGSSNGTFLNGVRLEEPAKIGAGDTIKFGILKVRVEEHTDTMPKVVSLKERRKLKKKSAATSPQPVAAAAGSRNGVKTTPPPPPRRCHVPPLRRSESTPRTPT